MAEEEEEEEGDNETEKLFLPLQKKEVKDEEKKKLEGI